MDEYSKYAFLGICHQGFATTGISVIRGLVDDIIPKSNASLDCVNNDLEKMFDHFTTGGRCVASQKCINPTRGEVLDSIRSIVDKINDFESSESSDCALTIYYSGHGNPDYGEFVLSGGILSAEQIYNCVAEYYHGARLDMDFVVDACHSGKFIAHALRTDLEDELGRIRLHDLWASCLPEELSYELCTIGHGAFTYCFLNKGNAYVDQVELAQAISSIQVDQQTNSVDAGSLRNIFKSLQGMTVPNPVTLMSMGKQHAFNICRRQHVSVDGGANFEVPDKITLNGLSNTLEQAKNAYGYGRIEYSDV